MKGASGEQIGVNRIWVFASGINASKTLVEKLFEMRMVCSTSDESQISADGVIGLRSAVIHDEGWSVLPAMSVHHYLREKKLLRVNVPTYIKDEVSVWWVRARKDMSETAKSAAKWISEFRIE